MKTIFIFLLTILTLQSKSQLSTSPIALQKVIGNLPGEGGMKPTILDTTTTYPGIPNQIKDYIVKYIKLNNQDFFGPSNIYMMIGKYQKDSLMVIVDANFNKNFSDDQRLIFPITAQNKTQQSITINKSVNGKMLQYMISPHPYSTSFKYSNNIENRLYLMVNIYEHLKGNINEETIFISNAKPFANYSNKELLTISTSSGTKFSMGEIIPIADKKIIIDSITQYGEYLYYKEINEIKDSTIMGATVGLKIEPFEANGISQEIIKIPSLQKIQLLDFWGTWCVPCRETLPKLKQIHQQYKDLEIISIAFDANNMDVNNYIKKEKLTWKNIFQGYGENEHPIITNLHIKAYPTFILIDKSGRIIYRGEGAEAISELNEVLQKIFN